MINTKNKAFTLVELLVVITILSIISVVAYQNFGGAVDKAVSGRKISDVSTIETSLQQYKVDNNYYPSVDEYDSSTNMWGYDDSTAAKPSNTLSVTMDGAEISTIDGADGGGYVQNNESTRQQIGAKGTISQDTLGKKYLTTDLYDPEVGDLEDENGDKLIESGIGRYVYAVYKKPTGTSWSSNKTGTYYNIAYTVKEDGSDTYYTRIVGDYDEQSCFDDSSYCPETLIGSGSGSTNDLILVDEQVQGEYSDESAISDFSSNQDNQGIPYPISDFE